VCEQKIDRRWLQRCGVFLHRSACTSTIQFLQPPTSTQAVKSSQPAFRNLTPCLPRGDDVFFISETEMSKPTDLVQGTLDLLLLKILALEPLHGWAISMRLRAMSGDVLQVSEGSLYPALHKLEERGLIVAEWGITEHNRRAKFYRLTTAGKKELESETANWKRLSAAIARVIQMTEV